MHRIVVVCCCLCCCVKCFFLLVCDRYATIVLDIGVVVIVVVYGVHSIVVLCCYRLFARDLVIVLFL